MVDYYVANEMTKRKRKISIPISCPFSFLHVEEEKRISCESKHTTNILHIVIPTPIPIPIPIPANAVVAAAGVVPVSTTIRSSKTY
ncbi:hypothetical protein M0804_008887 [Polistes exclamans]|nr:hypothetical protein M0804_008887 [Polistes exclamans]